MDTKEGMEESKKILLSIKDALCRSRRIVGDNQMATGHLHLLGILPDLNHDALAYDQNHSAHTCGRPNALQHQLQEQAAHCNRMVAKYLFYYLFHI